VRGCSYFYSYLACCDFLQVGYIEVFDNQWILLLKCPINILKTVSAQ
jgi:hypothetical protein